VASRSAAVMLDDTVLTRLKASERGIRLLLHEFKRRRAKSRVVVGGIRVFFQQRKGF